MPVVLTTEMKLSLPFWRYAAMYRPSGYAFLLDSAMVPQRLGRFSFLGGQPSALLTARRRSPDAACDKLRNGPGSDAEIRLEVLRLPDGTDCQEPLIKTSVGDPFTALRRLLADYAPSNEAHATDAPVTRDAAGMFASGLVGYFGYECAHFLENLPERSDKDAHEGDGTPPDLAFLVADQVLARDHQTGRTTLTVIGRGTTTDAATRDAELRTHELKRRLLRFEAMTAAAIQPAASRAGASPVSGSARAPSANDVPSRDRDLTSAGVRARFDRQRYAAEVQRCREHILAGDVFEVCLTQQLEADYLGDAWGLYECLREVNPAPFAAWLQFPDFQVVSASPERFLRLSADGTAESRPIKGTRPRGRTAEQDDRLRQELATSPKDRAENVMIVDLVRNDLGKVARTGSVVVPEMLAVESYATVFHLVSTICADLRPDCDAFDLVRACFPGGSMTGAPKIAAMQIIDAIEPVRRGVYSGAIGYFDHSGGLDLSIVIRALVCNGGRCRFGVGGAVVVDSDPVGEYEESLDKARALVAALELARSRDSAEPAAAADGLDLAEAEPGIGQAEA